MPVIKRPKDRGPLFGGRAQIMIGGPLVHQLREWKMRQDAASTKEEKEEEED
jgi:hypothetical protein